MRAAAADTLRAAPDASPAEIVGVGGTASNLAKMLPEATIDGMLTRERIARIQALLAGEPAATTAARNAINPVRARILPAGGAIVDAVLERYRVDAIRVSEAGLREGAILAIDHAGPAWRDRLADLAHGWRI
jgi:exopolyphosphatase/pppGpp-phosphohydrolase